MDLLKQSYGIDDDPAQAFTGPRSALSAIAGWQASIDVEMRQEERSGII